MFILYILKIPDLKLNNSAFFKLFYDLINTCDAVDTKRICKFIQEVGGGGGGGGGGGCIRIKVVDLLYLLFSCIFC